MQIIDEKSFKILVASENQIFRNALASRLRIEGFSVEFTEGGFHLLHLLEREKFNLIILNENLHDMSGYEVNSLIRTAHSKNELPVIYIAKSKSEENVIEMIGAGANDFIVQSTNFGPVVERIKKYFTAMKN
jgi:DNA-binding response OmpR family regulator